MKMIPKPNFTPRAQQAINESKKIAQQYGSEYVTLEHLFYGMVNLNGNLHPIKILLTEPQSEERFLKLQIK